LQVLTGPGQQDDVFGNLASEGWARSDWSNRRIIQCSHTKAHMLATFVRFNAGGKEYARYDGLYIIEYRNGFWGITARSTFAP
jgi:drug/metabolite transporter superfamily protein YnfA